MIEARIKADTKDVNTIRADKDELEKYHKKCRDKFTGILMLVLAHNSRFGRMRNKLENNDT